MTQIELRIDSGQIGAYLELLVACKHRSNRITIEQTTTRCRAASSDFVANREGQERERERERRAAACAC